MAAKFAIAERAWSLAAPGATAAATVLGAWGTTCAATAGKRAESTAHAIATRSASLIEKGDTCVSEKNIEWERKREGRVTSYF